MPPFLSWFLDNSDSDWAPPDSLLAFIAKARADQKPLVYVGFGSIVVPKPKAMTRSIIKAVLKSDVRVILNKGWSARVVAGGESTEKDEPEPELPDEVYPVRTFVYYTDSRLLTQSYGVLG